MSKHVVITPVKDEEEFIQDLIDSMVIQTKKPDLWIIVDDSSIDETKNITIRASNKYSWIHYISSESTSPRSRGKKIADLFILGLDYCEVPWDFCSKIDGDMVLPENYFERILSQFQLESKLGICSGNTYFIEGGRKRVERVTPNHTRGGLKSYRRDCFEDIGGIPPVNGWDGIDNALAAINGWNTKNLNDLFALHQRETGSVGGKYYRYYEVGVRSHYMGYGPAYMILKSIHSGWVNRSFLSPFFMLFGYFNRFLRQGQRYGDADFRREIRKQKNNELRKIFSFVKE